MKTAGKWLSFTVLAGLLAVFLAFSGCKEPENVSNKIDDIHGNDEEDENTTDIVSVTGISLKTTTSLVVGGLETLVPVITPSNATNKSVTWNSSNTNIATVSTDGTVTGVSVGSALIIAATRDGGFQAMCTVTVSPKPISVTGVSLNKESVSLAVGDTEIITANITPSDATNQNVIWNISNSGVAAVENGEVTALAAGTATITVTTVDGGYQAQCTVTVIVPVKSISLNKESTSLVVGYTETLFAFFGPEDANKPKCKMEQ